MSQKKVVLGLSGGVDSLASALLLQEQGYKVVGRTLKLSSNEKNIQEAESLARKIKIDFDVIDAQKPFQDKIVKPYIQHYLSGKTPSPCVWCNHEIKLQLLFEEMQKLKADYFATGHYIQLKHSSSSVEVYQAVDQNKDQSYFLWNVRYHLLNHWITPLGSINKQQVRDIAISKKMGFVAHKKESMGVCFIGKKGPQSFLKTHPISKKQIQKGKVLDLKGNCLGYHNGVSLYTIGQKKGLHIASQNKSVIQINATENTLIVGHSEQLYRSEFEAEQYHFFNMKDIKLPHITVKVRGIGKNPKGFGKIDIIDKNKIHIRLENPAWALSPGQPVVFYQSNRLLGGAFVI